MTLSMPRFRAFLAQARRDRLDLVHYTTPGPVGLVAPRIVASWAAAAWRG